MFKTSKKIYPKYLRKSLITMPQRIIVIIPALNEAGSIGKVIAAIPSNLVEEVIVADNGSSDQTAQVARQAGARVVNAPRRGYGSACLAALETISTASPPEVIVFIDGDYSDYPEDLPALLAPIEQGKADLVIGSRVLGQCEPGALTPQQRAGNALATFLIRILYKVRFSDLGPFRAITWEALQRLHMVDQNYGWTVEMQVKAAQLGLRCTEVPVRYRKRAGGTSKVSGTLRGSLKAGYKIILTILRYTGGG
jgi:glycosyltransferase involved in cell wall biosynthesis